MFMHFPIKRVLLTGIATAALALPGVSQARLLSDSPGQDAFSQPAQTVAATPAPQASASSGFEWGDAGIGAAGSILLVGAGAGAATAIRRRRAQRPITA